MAPLAKETLLEALPVAMMRSHVFLGEARFFRENFIIELFHGVCLFDSRRTRNHSKDLAVFVNYDVNVFPSHIYPGDDHFMLLSIPGCYPVMLPGAARMIL